ncbi:MAG: hypothetical protein ACLQD8_09380 [Thermoplasmata archaeon]
MPAPSVPQRFAPGGAYSLSAVTFSIRPQDAVSVGWPSMAVPLLRRARSLGVTTFDLSEASLPALAEEILVDAFPEEDPAVVALLSSPLRPREKGRRPGPSDPESADGPRPPLEGSLRRLGGRFRVVVEWDPAGEGAGDLLAPPESLLRLREEGRIDDIALRLSPGTGVPPGTKRALRTAPLSLLDLEVVNSVRRSGGPPAFALIARDAFAGGALDGSLLGGALSARGPTAPPPSLADLHGRLDPILRLGFLTRARSRTLARAALEFVLHWPWVLTAVVPLPPPERMGAVLEAAGGAEFTEEELRRIGVEPLGAGGPPSRGAT